MLNYRILILTVSDTLVTKPTKNGVFSLFYFKKKLNYYFLFILRTYLRSLSMNIRMNARNIITEQHKIAFS